MPRTRGRSSSSTSASSSPSRSRLAIYGRPSAFEVGNLDDGYLLVRRPIVSDGLSWRGVWWALSSVEVDWRPLTWLSHMVDFSVFGAGPGPQHLVNGAIHAANVGL